MIVALLLAIAAQSEAASMQSDLRTLGDAVIGTMPAGTEVLASCGESSGKTYYLWPVHKGWVEDAVTAGRLIFVASKEGIPDIVSRDAMGKFQSSAKLGAKLQFAELDATTGSFAVTETYQSGQVNSYVISRSPSGVGSLLWSTTRSHDTVANISKVSAFTASCVIY